MSDAKNGCGKLLAGYGGTMTPAQLDELARPTAEALENGVEPPDALAVIEKVRQEAEADQHDLTAGPQKDTDHWVGQHVMPEWWIGADCVNSNYDNALAVRSSEAEASTTMYQRMRKAYEKLHPNTLLSAYPMWGNDGD